MTAKCFLCGSEDKLLWNEFKSTKLRNNLMSCYKVLLCKKCRMERLTNEKDFIKKLRTKLTRKML